MTYDSTIYTNPDGLTQLYGIDRANIVQVGSPTPAGGKQVLTADFTFDKLQAFGVLTLLDPLRQTALPKGALITSASLNVVTAFAGSGATLDLGFYKTDGTTAIAATGLASAIALSSLNAVGDQVTLSGSLVNGVALTDDAIITAQVGTANFTAGRAIVTVAYIIPNNQ